MAITGTQRGEALAGRVFYACVRLRVFGLVRHWRNMWIRKTFMKRKENVRFVNDQKSVERSVRKTFGDNVSVVTVNTSLPSRNTRQQRKQRDAAVINASNIGTALMVTNSYRSLTMLCLIMGIFPMISLIYPRGDVDTVGTDMIQFLQGTNLQVDFENSTNCLYFVESVATWINAFGPRNKSSLTTSTDAFLLSLTITPPRCIDTFTNTTIGGISFYEGPCPTWNVGADADGASCLVGQLGGIFGNTSIDVVSDSLDLRVGNIVIETANVVNQSLTTVDGFAESVSYSVSASYNFTYSTEASALLSFLLQLCLLLTVLTSLIMLRYDAEHFVLRPLRSMLKIVARYAKNPLAQATQTGRDTTSIVSESDSDRSLDDDASDGDGFGTYETEQLISAVSKITDLLRKCWGVAGADIISTNLASREGELAEVFNPTVPGKSVYALFAFAAINGFDHALKCLGGDVMILINDVAQVLHGEVFRWGFGDSGQCNKNLGNAFLMVFRIGLVKEVVEKLEEATRVVFSTSEVKKINVKKRSRDKLPAYGRKASSDSNQNPPDRLRTGTNFYGGLKPHVQTPKHDSMTDAMQLSLQSLPGISTFTDRAVIGMLKSFAGIHRDKKLRNWSRDFRLSAGVGAWSVNMIFGMDAGWAVEGAVGSEYKIDATYLSPHVNMASRMMSACKHYGVTILLSEAVQELMSEQGKSRLRNVDRVTVKGSTQVQNIYTFDARSKGADFFLYSRSDDQADLEAERYQPNIWFDDQDLKAMRHHLTDDFEQEFMTGLKFYYEGNWPAAIERLEKANEIMVDAAMEEGYLHDEMDDSPDRKELYRTETADGPCKYLINFMKSQGGEAPQNWAGWHPLLSK
ncbi:adenylate and guanylate cyclase catalytic domain containing protein [Nitzschia inconspicua]|uniref:Adenylate and guanylate cyclase catalytic domain containing protein n=1 Tax=Nitzschia inconspicua TaxID=303405 RepID=A0A9K3KU54_9STRA|nr:adenylate and guanylate cyclase catalytic domain containing protein [Nitzschia inconspicua]